MFKLIEVNEKMGILEYELYQDIPFKEIGSDNEINGVLYDTYKSIIKSYIERKNIGIDELYNSKTTRYIFYVDEYPIGEIGIRTLKSDFWINNGSQLFYKIRLSERKKGYGSIMLNLALKECKKIGFDKIGINCDTNNIGSNNIIKNNGGLLIKTYERTDGGHSNRYEIKL